MCGSRGQEGAQKKELRVVQRWGKTRLQAEKGISSRWPFRKGFGVGMGCLGGGQEEHSH